MSTDTLEIFNNSDEWASQLKHALSQGEIMHYYMD